MRALPRRHPFRPEMMLPTLLVLLAMLLLGAWRDASAAGTYYVRTDGGDEKQCNGRADAAYPGSGSDVDCAWKHPYYALPTNDRPRIDGGDTLIIGPGDYMIGWGAPGLSENSTRCDRSATYDCYPAAPPSGPDPAHKTRILGQGFDSGCKAPPKLWGTERVELVFNLQDSDNVEVGCLEITDRSDCVEFHTDSDLRCERDSFPYGNWASIGIGAKRSRNVWLHDLNIHGLSGRGVMAGGLTDWTIERVRIIANGWAGWDGDVGEGESSNEGDIIFRNVEIAWNGCAERWQTGEPIGCWAQEEGGYGDGLGTGKTNGHWVVEDSRIHHNTSDGLDLLYMDESRTGTTVVRRVYAAANAGNQIKTAGNALIENSVVIGQCAYFHKKFNMTDGDMCRAYGNALSIGVGRKHTATVRHNTITGEGDCLILTAGGDASSRIDIQNNALVGQPDLTSGDKGEMSCGHYADESKAVVTFSGNAFWNVKDDQCPPGNLCRRDPKLKGMDMADFDAVPLEGSPLIDHASQLTEVTSDYLKHARPVGAAADIGAIEVQGARAAAPAAGAVDSGSEPQKTTGSDAGAASKGAPAAEQSSAMTIGAIVIASLLAGGVAAVARKQRSRSAA
ncbi:right-handed parallel beta-helix repeat-containing protein [Lysobacter sp. S4-A87]|uniref:right-handed parallel beta-helix repeat-containing protein n=1 Tax=Lysobacter sp. S4-A87 TaxID=2925843 RepID=UPI001F52F762|nr:right-handed parallel beta-helix repeat-containing protein [Lysobacter sp. S4-A87]UNK50275.1 right-handed parallel beta-helix repeat-containing protein [Lysobacter sp. S4-A87]